MAAEIRPWHVLECRARDAGVGLEECVCPPERWLDPFAVPVPEPGEAEATSGVTGSLPGLTGD